MCTHRRPGGGCTEGAGPSLSGAGRDVRLAGVEEPGRGGDVAPAGQGEHGPDDLSRGDLQGR